MLLLFLSLACLDKSGTAVELSCVGYSYCCTTYCENEEEASHYGEPDPCDCDESYVTDPRECAPVEGECQFIAE